MSDYIKITDYAAKDALLTGNPAKLVKGTEIGADFDAVAVAVATKHDATDIGVTVQAYDADLTTWAGITPGTGIATALAVNVGTAGAPVINGGALGTPSSGTLTNCTGTPASLGLANATGLPAAGVTGTALTLAGGNLTGVLGLTAGTALLPAIIPTGDPNTGVWFPAADTVAVSTGGTERMRIDSNGNVGIGVTPITATTLYLGQNVTGATTGYGIRHNQTILSDVTSSFIGNSSGYNTQGAAFTLSNLYHFNASQGTFNGPSIVTNQYGFQASAGLTGATNNYGFYGNIAAAAGRWNFYAAGTAANYFAGVCQFADGTALLPSITNISDENTGVWFPAADTVAVSTGGAERMRIDSAGSVGIGGTAPTGVNLYNVKSLSGATSAWGTYTLANVTSGVTANALLYDAAATTEAAAFTLSNLFCYRATQGAFGATSAVTNQYGFHATSSLIGATNNYGFYGNLASAANRYNFYAAGTADNAYAGNSSFGQVVAPIAAVDTTSFATNLVTNTAANYTVLTSDHTIIQTTAGSTYTLPAAASFTGRKLHLVTQFAGTVISASSNVVPLAGGAAGTAILAATAGKFATLQSNGTNWIIIASN